MLKASYLTQRNSALLSLIIVSTAVFLSVLDIFIVNVALPSIKTGLHGSDADLQLIIALYLLGHAIFLVTAGRLGDYYGRKRMFIIGMTLFVISSCYCGFANTPLQMNAARFLQGTGAALMLPQSITYIQLLFPDPQQRIKALGIYGSIAGTASIIGQLLGGILPDLHTPIAGWRLIFLINLPIGITAIIAAWKMLPETNPEKDKKFDWMGVFILTITLCFLIFPLVYGRELGWPAWTQLLLVASIVFLFIFVKQQLKKSADALIDMRLFRFKDFKIGLLAVLFYFMVQDSYFLINAILMQTGLGYSSSAAGILFVFQGIGYVIASIWSIRLVPIYGKRVLQTGIGIMVITLIAHIFFFTLNTNSFTMLSIILFAYGTGCGSVLPSLLTMTLKSIPVGNAGTASGVFTTLQQTAIALGVCIPGGLFFYIIQQTGYIPAYQVATSVNIGLLLLTGYCLYKLPEA
ncbi:MFS transporter [Chitinophaga silvatica]|uniref:MFS transporter n=1 Tax=Chitinophaga silvatica TaxID=2282649 RepID=A0A3E1Y7M2_9BACT|nr:MFS transporter [Chitinophaga silvatica]RFS21046.1 MFS transporter [Chitinophaga silvatica]